MNDDLAPTVTVTMNSPVETADVEFESRLAPAERSASDGVTNRLNDATRQILRSRLFIATCVWTCVVLIAGAVDLLSGEASILRLSVKGIVSAFLVSCCIYLHQHKSVTLTRLRWLEFTIGSVALSEVMLVLVSTTEDLVAKSQAGTIPELRVFIAMATCLFIAVYGIFIPSNWRRTAFITVITALVPSIVIMIHTWQNPALQAQINDKSTAVAIPMFTLMMAGIATAGAHIVHRTRRQVELARQYGQYRLLDEIGRGGMGIVFKAQHRMLKRPAAIKLIRSDAAFNEQAIQAFEREVQISATLSHWNTVQIYDYGRTEAGDFYYVMEYLEGQTLQQRLSSVGSLSVPATVEIVRQICDGLQEAHAKNMIHRDLKPANIFLADTAGQSDVVKIVDFGLAQNIQEVSEADRGKICGTPQYMSPEQTRGDSVDGRSDIYAIGCIMYECLSGEPVFEGDSIKEVLEKQLYKVPELCALPASALAVKPIIECCLSKRPEKRFANGESLRNAISDL